MSTTNTENLTLYAHPKLYNGSRYVYYQTDRDYDAYLLESSESVITKTVYFKSLTEDMELNSPVKDILKYTYGKLTNDGKDFYIFIDNIVTDQHGKSYISFSVDWWATEWFNIHPSIAHIKRSSYRPLYMAQPFQPLYTEYSSVSFNGESGKKGCIMFTYIPSHDNQDSYISLGMMNITDKTLALVQTGYWYQKLGIAGADIKDCFIVPLVDTDDIVSGEQVLEYYVASFNAPDDIPYTIGHNSLESMRSRYPHIMNDLPTSWEYFYPISPTQIPADINFGKLLYNEKDGKFYRVWRYYYSSEQGYLPFGRRVDIDISYYGFSKAYSYEEKTLNQWQQEIYVFESYILSNNDETIEAFNFSVTGLNIKSNEYQTMGINDWNSDLIWECPYGVTVTSFNIRLLLGISHIMLEFIANGQTKNGSKLTGIGFSYDCRHPGLFVDSYQDYILKNRDYDIAMRQIQSDKQIWAAAASTAENVGFGFAFGNVSGGAAAGVGGLIETVSTYIINKEFDPKIQEQYNLRYKRMTDQISLVGDSITNVYNERENGLLQVYTLLMDLPSRNRMANDINVNGYVCDEFIDDLESLFDVEIKIQADNVVVEGATCLEAKHQTVYRLQNGVEFI